MRFDHQPAEWDTHEACWLAWPSAADLWLENLPAAQSEFTELCRTIAAGERLEVLVPTAQDRADAQKALAGLPVRFHDIPFGDIWLRDTAPIFVKSSTGDLATARFVFNGWGGKYVLPHDHEVASKIATSVDLPSRAHSYVLEGGSIEVDGEGTCLTTRQCLLNPNRNPSLSQSQIETALRESIGAEKTLWLGDGLINDHTDGHIDTIARFVAPGKVVCMEARDPADPNRAILDQIAHDLSAMTDARGRRLEVIRIPSPGVIENEDGDLMPASYVNFYIGNKTVAVPTYGSRFDAEAVAGIAKLFPGRKTVGLSAYAILSGGGAFHCITQQQPGLRNSS